MGQISPRPPLPATATPEEMAADLARMREEIRRRGLLNAMLFGLLTLAVAALVVMDILANAR